MKFINRFIIPLFFVASVYAGTFTSTSNITPQTALANRVADSTGTTFLDLATSANQTTAIAYFASIDINTMNTNANVQTVIANQTNKTQFIKLTDGIDTALITPAGELNVTGTIATGGLTDAELRATPVPVSLTSTTITGTVAATQSGTWNINNVSGTVSLPTGASTATNQTTLGSQTTKINDGTDTLSITAAGEIMYSVQ